MKAYVAEMSCHQLQLIDWFCYVHAHQDQLTSYHNEAMSLYDIIYYLAGSIVFQSVNKILHRRTSISYSSPSLYDIIMSNNICEQNILWPNFFANMVYLQNSRKAKILQRTVYAKFSMYVHIHPVDSGIG